ncbi:hypothetical protein DFA_05889, partial [Cavenderia fasciculata]
MYKNKHNSLSFLRVVSIASLLLFTLTFISISNATLPSDELQSIEWLIKQYGQGIPVDQTICNGTFLQNIQCSDPDSSGTQHITYLYLNRSFNDVGSPDPNLSQLVFPSLISMLISCSTTKNQSLSVLSLLENLPNLQTLKIENDPSIKIVPSDFPKNMPNLSAIGFLDTVNLYYIPTFFNYSTVAFIHLKGVEIRELSISNLTYLPELNSLPKFSIRPVSYFSLDFQTKSFPSLRVLDLEFTGPNIIDVNINSTVFAQIFFNMTSAPINLWIDKSNNMQHIYLEGAVNFQSDMKDYQNLSILQLINSSISSFPFTAYPPNLENFCVTGASNLLAFPNIPIPPSITTFIMTDGQLTGSLPLGAFENVSPRFGVNLQNNPDLVVGDVPESWCNFRTVNLNGTIVNSVPDCFYCYYLDPATAIPIPPPIGFTCPIEIQSLYLLSHVARVTVIGNNIGWGYPSGYPIIPNKMIEYTTLYTPGPNRTVDISFGVNQLYNYSFNVLEVGFVVANAIVNLKNTGDFNELVIHFIYFNPYHVHTVSMTDNNINCTVTSQTADNITCLFPRSTPISPSFKYVISNPYYSQLNIKDFYYPTVTSFTYFNETNLLRFYGQFGFDLSPASIKVADTINCDIQTILSFAIICKLASNPPNGPANLYVNVNGSEFRSSSLLYFGSPNNNNGSGTTGGSSTGGSGETAQQQCQRLTHNCYGHGVCDISGKCQCIDTYNPIDNCLTKYINTTITPNATNPTVNFNIDGIDFYFEIYSVQEMDYDGGVIQELSLIDETWNVTLTTNNQTQTTMANYTLNTTTIVKDNMYSEVSFSSIARNVTFGEQVLSLAPNAIKVGFTISKWPYTSNVATLRVVFKSIINNDQSVTFDCEKQSIDSFTKEELSSSIQYLRVVQDNIQFNGRFIDFVLSDDRATYSKTELISLTPIEGDDDSDQSIALIGINLPQCSLCKLDPDFTPLVVDRGSDSGRDCDKQSNTWRIIVGSVVGGIGLTAALAGTAIYLRKRRW